VSSRTFASSIRAGVAVLFVAAAAVAAPPPLRELPELPRVPDIAVSEPSMAELAEVDEVLGRIAGEDNAQREEGVRQILELGPRLVPAMRRRLAALADSSDKGALKRLLYDIRRAAKDEPQDDVPGAPEKSDKGPDYLTLLVDRARPGLPAYRDLVRVIALSRMLEHVATTPAARGIVDVYVRFGDFLRIDTQKALARLGDRAVPALIEARKHQAEKIARWAGRQLDALGRAAPSQAVQIPDPAVLADVFRAYGRTRDLDAARIIISFAGSERAQLREASRQAIALFGESGHWQLRDAYEDVVGKRAARDWTWERTARELFGELDRLRRVELSDRFEAGQKALAAGDLDAMRAAYDEVLARVPFFERADEMVGGYWDFGQKHADDRREDAIAALYRAERLSRGKPHHDRIESLLLTLNAERLAETGVADRNLLRRALELDPGNTRARTRMTELSLAKPTAQGNLRYALAGGFAGLGLLGVLLVLFLGRGGKSRPKAPPEPANRSQPPLETAQAGSRQAEPQAAESEPAPGDEKTAR
jgi:hypothetical protein